MRRIDIEIRARRAVERLLDGQVSEDSSVEFKREYPVDKLKAARQLAALANAARAEPVMWLVGVDEKAKTVTGARADELSIWWAEVRSTSVFRVLIFPPFSETQSGLLWYFLEGSLRQSI